MRGREENKANNARLDGCLVQFSLNRINLRSLEDLPHAHARDSNHFSPAGNTLVTLFRLAEMEETCHDQRFFQQLRDSIAPIRDSIQPVAAFSKAN